MDVDNPIPQDQSDVEDTKQRTLNLCEKYDQQLKIYKSMIKEKDEQVRLLKDIQAANERKIAQLEKQLEESLAELQQLQDQVTGPDDRSAER
ncbi:uncharacterized protein BKCO1_12000153 [Diplodia corticola]|uniref:Uncharacterized protein n=1 Tax=Diplodia corticola TaxID=236234 RepID=A0A1J9R854_9PEZI|nr:uncharacterized protein BKCO1_12000153 [Diplodia corticola]OJD36378.1 hypothetical protein BKCO1_12000153 [Diplodia corticola]